MAENMSRSMNAELAEGATDGKYKKTHGPDKAGPIDPATAANKSHLDPAHYGNVNVEAPVKILGDGTLDTGGLRVRR